MPDENDTAWPPSSPPSTASKASQVSVASVRLYRRSAPSTKFDAGMSGVFRGAPGTRSGRPPTMAQVSGFIAAHKIPSCAFPRSSDPVSNSPSMPILGTKLRPPRPRRRLVQRARLTDRLGADRGEAPRLILIAAPAGFGKTTLLAQWAAESERRVAWLALDAGDADPRQFL